MAPIFNRKKRLADYSYDELMQERARLEAAEQKTLRELQRLEEEKSRNFEEAKQAGSASVRQVHARKIRDINHRIDGLQGNIRRLGKLIRVVDLTMAQMEQGRLTRESSPLVKAIAGTDAQDLQDWVDRVVSGEAVAEQKLDDLLRTFDEAEEMRGRVSTGDAEVDAILAEIERAAATEALTREMKLESEDAKAADTTV
jgi:ABC-type transporter Mla subunit MlaD